MFLFLLLSLFPHSVTSELVNEHFTKLLLVLLKKKKKSRCSKINNSVRETMLQNKSGEEDRMEC